ncbi:MAG: class I SAM-dependent methyltransferase [Leptolyngbyaceae cyanobacterium RU_5_1]|nr:class I SAM-dependent methyltransferase [Leptolyngbyaceae cyanobacterium RU_5_1]
MRSDTVWQSHVLVENFLTSVRGGIPFAMEQIQIALRVLDQTGRSITQVADLGCGDGTIAQAILTHYPQSQVCAIDFSEPMLNQAKQNLSDFGDRVRFIQADLYYPNWQAELEPFDAIVSGYCIHHLPDERKRSLYREIYGLLESGGYFLNIEHVASTSSWIEALFNDVLIDSLYQWHQSHDHALSKEEVARRFVYREDKDANILASVETQCEWLREIGFQHVDCYFKFFELAVFGGMRM